MTSNERITITAIDLNSSNTMSRTFSTLDIDQLVKDLGDFELDIPYLKYELMCDDLFLNPPKILEDIFDLYDISY